MICIVLFRGDLPVTLLSRVSPYIGGAFVQHPCLTNITIQDIGRFCQTLKMTFFHDYNPDDSERDFCESILVDDELYRYNVARMVTFAGPAFRDLMSNMLKFVQNGFAAVAPKNELRLNPEGKTPILETAFILGDEIVCLNGSDAYNQAEHDMRPASYIVAEAALYQNNFASIFYVYNRIVVVNVQDLVVMCQSMFTGDTAALMEYIGMVLYFLSRRNQVFVLLPPSVTQLKDFGVLKKSLLKFSDYYEFKNERIGELPLIIDNVVCDKVSE